MSEEKWSGEQQGEQYSIPQQGTPEYDQFVQYMQQMQEHYEQNGVPAEGTPEYEQYVQFVQQVQQLYAQAGVPEEGTPEYEQYMQQMQAQQYAAYLAQQEEPSRTFVPDYVPENTNVSIDDMKVSNTAQRVRVIVGIAVIVVLAAIGLIFFMNSARDVEAHKAARAAFDEAHKKGSAAFWVKARIETASFKDASEFNSQVLKAMRKSLVKYAQLLKGEALPILDSGLAAYQAVKAPEAYKDKLAAVLEAYKGERDAVTNFAGQLLMIDGLLEAKTKLRRMNDAWFNAQTWEDPQYGVEGFRYYKLVSCLLEGRPLIEIPAVDLMAEISKSCSEKKDAWFKRAALECFPMLLTADEQPSTAYNETVAAYRKKGAEKKPEGVESLIDETSSDAIGACVEDCEREFEYVLVAQLKASWDKYEAARKAFLDANNAALGQ
jgi:hypothetical protein